MRVANYAGVYSTLIVTRCVSAKMGSTETIVVRQVRYAAPMTSAPHVGNAVTILANLSVMRARHPRDGPKYL